MSAALTVSYKDKLSKIQFLSLHPDTSRTFLCTAICSLPKDLSPKALDPFGCRALAECFLMLRATQGIGGLIFPETWDALKEMLVYVLWVELNATFHFSKHWRHLSRAIHESLMIQSSLSLVKIKRDLSTLL